MKKKVLKVLCGTLAACTLFATPVYAGINMERMYNPNSGEHFYTANTGEKNYLIKIGWKDEGVGWVAPSDGDPVYRLYNPNTGDHHYTLNTAEKNYLVKAGWRYEGIGWYSDGGIPIYREYNPNAKTGAHNYTTNKAENDRLVQSGWRAEGIGWYGTGLGWSVSNSQGKNTTNSIKSKQTNLKSKENYIIVSDYITKSLHLFEKYYGENDFNRASYEDVIYNLREAEKLANSDPNLSPLGEDIKNIIKTVPEPIDYQPYDVDDAVNIAIKKVQKVKECSETLDAYDRAVNDEKEVMIKLSE